MKTLFSHLNFSFRWLIDWFFPLPYLLLHFTRKSNFFPPKLNQSLSINQISHLFSGRATRLIDRLIDWSIDWLIDWLIDWSIDWLIETISVFLTGYHISCEPQSLEDLILLACTSLIMRKEIADHARQIASFFNVFSLLATGEDKQVFDLTLRVAFFVFFSRMGKIFPWLFVSSLLENDADPIGSAGAVHQDCHWRSALSAVQVQRPLWPLATLHPGLHHSSLHWFLRCTAQCKRRGTKNVHEKTVNCPPFHRPPFHRRSLAYPIQKWFCLYSLCYPIPSVQRSSVSPRRPTNSANCSYSMAHSWNDWLTMHSGSKTWRRLSRFIFWRN